GRGVPAGSDEAGGVVAGVAGEGQPGAVAQPPGDVRVGGDPHRAGPGEDRRADGGAAVQFRADRLPPPGRSAAAAQRGRSGCRERLGAHEFVMTGTALSAAPPSPGREAGTGEAHLTLEITGMTCASCVRRVERALTAVPGVAAAAVNLAAESADVTLARPVEAGVLVTAVADAGYQAAVRATG